MGSSAGTTPRRAPRGGTSRCRPRCAPRRSTQSAVWPSSTVGFEPGEDPVGALAHGRGCGSGRRGRRARTPRAPPCRAAHPSASARAGRARRGLRRDRREHRGREVRAGNGNRPISSSTTTMSTRPSPRPPLLLGDEQARPAELDSVGPQSSVKPRLVVDHRPARRRLRAGRRGTARTTVAQRVLIVGEREVHGVRTAIGKPDSE